MGEVGSGSGPGVGESAGLSGVLGLRRFGDDGGLGL